MRSEHSRMFKQIKRDATVWLLKVNSDSNWNSFEAEHEAVTISTERESGNQQKNNSSRP